MATLTKPKPPAGPPADRRPWAELPEPPEIPDLGSLDEGYRAAKATLDRLQADEAKAAAIVDAIEAELEDRGEFGRGVEALLRGEEPPAADASRDRLREARKRRDLLRVAVDRAKAALDPHEGRARAKVAELLRPYREFLALAALHAAERLKAIEDAQDRLMGELRRVGLMAEMVQSVLPRWFSKSNVPGYARELRDAGAITAGVAATFGVEGRAIVHAGNGKGK